MAAEQNRPAQARPEVAQPKTQELNVDAGLRILFGTPDARTILLFHHYATPEMRGCLRFGTASIYMGKKADSASRYKG